MRGTRRAWTRNGGRIPTGTGCGPMTGGTGRPMSPGHGRRIITAAGTATTITDGSGFPGTNGLRPGSNGVTAKTASGGRRSVRTLCSAQTGGYTTGVTGPRRTRTGHSSTAGIWGTTISGRTSTGLRRTRVSSAAPARRGACGTITEGYSRGGPSVDSWSSAGISASREPSLWT